jgi:hypothetical protein
MAERSKATAYGPLLAGIAGSNLAGGMDLSLVSVVCCQVEVSPTGRLPIQRSPTDCGVLACVIYKPQQ